ncbi:MAG: hypothetical protein JJ957_20740 [Pseudomonadales bacterium]|nr:hypothetical protein [Pseudomonadales bacterium]MBO6598013.1 hypothetical protein [Pseudomonadales bacterium]MBO6824539.1 hypothetical protein [Pseudomonadales bacterium]
MKLTLELSLFKGALGEVSLPDFDPDNPFQAGLILDGFEEPVGVELLEVLELSDACTTVVSQTTDPEMSLLAEGSEFFLTRSGKMLGKGRIEQAGI